MRIIFEQHGVFAYNHGMIKQLIRAPGTEVFLLGREFVPAYVFYEKPILEHPRIQDVVPCTSLREIAEEVYRFFSGNILGSFRHVTTYAQMRSVIGKCDLIHLNSCSSNALMYLLRHFARKPFLVTVHNLPDPAYKSLPSRKMFEWNERRILKQMRSKNIEVATVSEFMRSMLQKEYGITSKVIHHGVDPELFNPAVSKEKMRQLLNIPQEYTCILWVGYLDPVKDPLTLMRAVPLILKKHKKVMFIVVRNGKGRFDQMILGGINSGIYRRNLLFIGRVPYASMPFMYAAADIYVSTSIQETFGLSVLEAMACGKAVVVSDQQSLLEVLNGKGLVFQKGKPQDLADKLALLVEDETLRARIGISAHLRTREHFTWKRAAAEYMRMYRHVIDEKGLN